MTTSSDWATEKLFRRVDSEEQLDRSLDATLARIRDNLEDELEILPKDPTNPHATAAKVAVQCMILALRNEIVTRLEDERSAS